MKQSKYDTTAEAQSNGKNIGNNSRIKCVNFNCHGHVESQCKSRNHG